LSTGTISTGPRQAGRIGRATELDEAPVASAFHHSSVMHGDGGVDQIAPERPQPRQCAILVGASKPARPRTEETGPGIKPGI